MLHFSLCVFSFIPSLDSSAKGNANIRLNTEVKGVRPTRTALLLESVQVRIFPINEVNWESRVKKEKRSIFYGNISAYNLRVVPTKLPQSVIVAMGPDMRTHYFLYDNQRIRRCLWEGYLTFDEKLDISCEVVQWMTDNEKSVEFLIQDHEDGSAMAAAAKIMLVGCEIKEEEDENEDVKGDDETH